ncbi:hypothetical protein [Paenibacillus sp. 598K]|uniref:hypothetical protein n=1 Tax=Paenibacillus sp. 598K TaxID=1117987 RepID=UPI00162ADE01|nr:hypothetical protein [Paenibacillus sp. 598K]
MPGKNRSVTWGILIGLIVTVLLATNLISSEGLQRFLESALAVVIDIYDFFLRLFGVI